MTRVFPDRQTEKEKVPEVEEKEKRTYARVPIPVQILVANQI